MTEESPTSRQIQATQRGAQRAAMAGLVTTGIGVLAVLFGLALAARGDINDRFGFVLLVVGLVSAVSGFVALVVAGGMFLVALFLLLFAELLKRTAR